MYALLTHAFWTYFSFKCIVAFRIHATPFKVMEVHFFENFVQFNVFQKLILSLNQAFLKHGDVLVCSCCLCISISTYKSFHDLAL